MNMIVNLLNQLRLFKNYQLNGHLAKILDFVLPRKLVNAIVIESHTDFDSNGGALYDYLIRNGYNRRYKIVLFLNEALDRELPENVVGSRLLRPSLRNAYYACRAKYLFADNRITKKWRQGQVSVYLSHGIPIKNTHGVIVLNDDVDYCLSPSKWFDRHIRDAFTIGDTVKTLHLGYPRLDIMYKDGESVINLLLSGLESQSPKGTEGHRRAPKKVILWMPTFRSLGSYRIDSDVEQRLGIPLIDSMDDYEKLNGFLSERNCLLIIKLHPLIEPSRVKVRSMSNIVVVTGKDMARKKISNWRLYRDIDAMISDYSSASFDFMQLDRPLCYDFSDLEHYKLGLITDNPDELLPGPKIRNLDGLYNFFEDVVNGNDNFSGRRKEVLDKLFEHWDGNSCERIVKFLGI